MTYNSIQSENLQPWNMNLAYLMRLDKRLDERDSRANEGALFAWYRALRTIYSNIHWRVKGQGTPEEERLEKEIEDLLNKIKSHFMKVSKGNDPLSRQMQSQNLSNVEIQLDELDKKINDLIFKYKFINFDKEVRDPGRAIEYGKFS